MATRRHFFRFITVNPVLLSEKGKVLSVIACFISILFTAWINKVSGLTPGNPMIIASMGASAVILFIVPHSPLAQPWPLVGGQLVSAFCGVACAQLIPDPLYAAAVAVSGSVIGMLLLRCLHPPGAATALTPVMAGGSLGDLGFDFVVAPVGINVFAMLMMALVLNRWLLKHQYPIPLYSQDELQSQNQASQLPPSSRINAGEIVQALASMDTFVDVSADDLKRLIEILLKNHYKRGKENLTCSDIMTRDIASAEYGTEVEAAWTIMHRQKLKAMPVIDRSRRVIGIITWHDFFKYVEVKEGETFREKLQTFLRRTKDVRTDKPESVGHIMTRQVNVLAENTHIVELVPLMTDQGYRQIPIVDHENRLVGMISQDQLIVALYETKCQYAS